MQGRSGGHPLEKRGFLMNWLHTEGQTCSAQYALDCRRNALKIKNVPGARAPHGPLPAVKYSFVKCLPPPSVKS